MEGARPVRAPRGTTLTAKSWQTEAPLRMLMNNLDPENAERPDDLVVYGGTGRAARDWRSFDAMVRTLTTLEKDETMLVQSGRPVGVMRTHEWAPRVLIANSNLVGDWATWPEFRRLEHLGLTMYGQMTAGSWIYIGTQGILQGTYETFAAVAEKRFGGTLAGTLTLTGGCGGMGGAQPLAVTLNEGVCLIVDVDRVAAAAPGRAPLPRRGRRRPRRRGRVGAAGQGRAPGAGRSASSATAPTVFPELLRRGVDDRHRHRPDQRPRPAVLPARGRRPRRLARLRRAQARGVHRPGPRLDGQARRGHGRLPGRRRRGLRLRQLDPRRGPAGRLRPRVRLPRLRPGLHPPAVLRGQGPVPLGGALRRPQGHRTPPTGPCWTSSPTTTGCRSGCAARRSGSRSRGCRPGSAGSATASGTRPGCGSTSWSPPASCQRADRHRPRPPRLRLGRLALPRDRVDGSTAPTRSPTGRCSTRWSTPRPARPGCRSTTAAASASAGRSTPARSRSPTAPTLAAQKLARVLTNDPGMGVIRHVDAGYDRADEVAGERGVRIPMREG